MFLSLFPHTSYRSASGSLSRRRGKPTARRATLLNGRSSCATPTFLRQPLPPGEATAAREQQPSQERFTAEEIALLRQGLRSTGIAETVVTVVLRKLGQAYKNPNLTEAEYEAWLMQMLAEAEQEAKQQAPSGKTSRYVELDEE
ncbi:MAG: hypothetical protein ACJ788_09650 [Ktedonobacteraceae bacterium]